MGLEHPWILVSMAGWGGSWNQSPVDTEEQLVQYPARGYWMKENYSLFICYFFVNLSVNSYYSIYILSLFFFKLIYFIYLFILVALGLHCCAGATLRCGVRPSR